MKNVFNPIGTGNKKSKWNGLKNIHGFLNKVK